MHVIGHRFIVPQFPDAATIESHFETSRKQGVFSNFGPLSRLFEERCQSEFGLKDEVCITCSSATSGLSAALLAAGVHGPVIVPAFTFPATLGAVRAASLEPVLADVCPATWAISCEQINQILAVSPADAVVLVAPFGIQLDWRETIDACRQRNLTVIIDNAAGLGAERLARPVTPHVLEVFSLHATKPFCVGEGGLVFCHREMSDRVRGALNFGLPRPDGTALRWGFNGKLSELHAAVALAQLDRIGEAVANRQTYFDSYSASLPKDYVLPGHSRLAPWQCIPCLAPDSDTAERFVEEAASRCVELRRYYRPSLAQLHPDVVSCDCSVSIDLSNRMCTLPVRATGDKVEREEIVTLVSDAASVARSR